MIKKIISLMIIFAMLVPFSSAVAADENASQPTIEEILNGYHQKAFEARIAEENGGASAYSRRSGSEKTLEEETVDELTAAGYEAYNVTGDNYESLEVSLHTDFSQLGIDPDYSYIIVISGEEGSATSNSSRSSDVLLPPHTEDGSADGSSWFYYDFMGNTYQIRYVTVTAAQNSNMAKASAHPIYNAGLDPQTTFEDFLVTSITAWAEKLACDVPIGDILSLLGVDIDLFTQTYCSTLTFNAGTNWTRKFAEVYDSELGIWEPSASFSYATLYSSITGICYDADNNQFQDHTSNQTTDYVYSYYYNNYDWLKAAAVEAFYLNRDNDDGTGPITYRCHDLDGNVFDIATHYETA